MDKIYVLINTCILKTYMPYNLFSTDTLHVVYYRFNQKSDSVFIYTDIQNSIKKNEIKNSN